MSQGYYPEHCLKFILEQTPPGHIHQSGDILLHQLGEIKIRRLLLAVQGSLPNPVHHIPIDKHA